MAIFRKMEREGTLLEKKYSIFESNISSFLCESSPLYSFLMAENFATRGNGERVVLDYLCSIMSIDKFSIERSSSHRPSFWFPLFPNVNFLDYTRSIKSKDLLSFRFPFFPRYDSILANLIWILDYTRSKRVERSRERTVEFPLFPRYVIRSWRIASPMRSVLISRDEERKMERVIDKICIWGRWKISRTIERIIVATEKIPVVALVVFVRAKRSIRRLGGRRKTNK